MFLQLTIWINEKMLTAQDTSYEAARNLHSKWLKHQAFKAEIESNKDRLQNIDMVNAGLSFCSSMGNYNGSRVPLQLCGPNVC